MDLGDFYDSFFEEAAELLDDMERHLLALEPDNPDQEQLNAIFRAAHSIKGGAGTFGFDVLQSSTHLLENLLDRSRRGELILRHDIVDTFLEAKDMLQEQLDDYRHGQEPEPDAYLRICRVLQQLAQEEEERLDNPEGASAATAGWEASAAADSEPAVSSAAITAPATQPEGEAASGCRLLIALLGVTGQDYRLLREELTLFGELIEERELPDRYEVVLDAQASADDIAAVMCFILEPEQLEIQTLDETASLADAVLVDSPPEASCQALDEPAQCDAGLDLPVRQPARIPGKNAGGEASSLRVPVTKIDQIINLMGELIITQSMLV
ncbi:MAG: chemotaxis protein CheA, partial [Alphaproteobacteria bacterium]|nr:chemotaxis protein CheA [Alphaproteobacteria bacterium]